MILKVILHNSNWVLLSQLRRKWNGYRSWARTRTLHAHKLLNIHLFVLLICYRVYLSSAISTKINRRKKKKMKITQSKNYIHTWHTDLTLEWQYSTNKLQWWWWWWWWWLCGNNRRIAAAESILMDLALAFKPLSSASSSTWTEANTRTTWY